MSEFLDKTGFQYFWGKLKTLLSGKANGNSAGTALKTEGIPFGEVDSTSTATAFTATVPGISELKDGTVVMLRNGVVTSASGFTINVNGLGAKPVYNNMATGNETTPTAPTRDTTIFNINYTMMFIYQSDLVSGGAWICYRGYDANTNTVGYQLRTNSATLPASDTGYRYRLWLTSADGTKWVPINTSTSTNATTARTLNTRKIDPFGAIVYNSTNGTVNANSRPSLSALWQQYTLTVGYSYVLSMTAYKPVYLKCTPQTDGSAVMDVLTQTLPTSKDGKIYLFLGIAYSATAMELRVEHPVYWHDGTGIRIWTGAEPSGGGTYTLPAATASTLGGVKVGSGLSVTSDGTLSASGGGGGGANYRATTALLPTSGWSNNVYRANVPGVIAANDVIVGPAPASAAEWAASGIVCTAQENGVLTFTRTKANTSTLTANVLIFFGGLHQIVVPPGQESSSFKIDGVENSFTSYWAAAGSSIEIAFIVNPFAPPTFTVIRDDTGETIVSTPDNHVTFTMPDCSVTIIDSY